MGDVEAQPATLNAGPLRLEFRNSGDRFAHGLLCASDGVPRPLMESVECEGAAEELRSPPYQQLHFEEHDGRSIAMLVGMAGGNHWSAAISAGDDALEFDVACRVGRDTPALESCYRVPESVTIQPTAGGILLQVSTATVSIQPGQGTEIDTQGHMLCLRPSDYGPESRSTCRWRYAISA